MATNSWEKLPISILINIFSFLQLRDRRNASLTCKAWATAFKNPRLWRYLCLDFSDLESDRLACKGDVSYTLVSHCYQSLQYLNIFWYALDSNPQQERFTLMMTDFFNSIVKNGTIPQLKTLLLTEYTLTSETQVHLSENVDSLIISVARFLRTQKHLEKFWLLWELSSVHEALLVDALCCNSAKSLKSFENIPRKVSPFTRFPNVLKLSVCQFSNLNILILSYETFGEDLLDSVINACESLNLIRLHVSTLFLNFRNGKPHLISSAKWKEATQKLPNLKVQFEISHSLSNTLVSWSWQVDLFKDLLPVTIPLAGFVPWDIRFPIECINHLVNFSKTLERLSLLCKQEVIPTLLDLLERCPHLNAMRLMGDLPLSIIDFLERLKMIQYKELEFVDLVFDNLSADEEKELISRRNSLNKQLNWQFKILLPFEQDDDLGT